MFHKIKYLISLNLLWLIAACTTTNNKPLSIAFSSDSSKIVISAINDAGLFQIKSKIKTDTTYQKLVAVLQTPVDDDSTSMEIEWSGKLALMGDSLIFTPKNSFVKGKAYLIETFINAQFASGEDIIKSNVGHQIKAQQKLLRR